MVANVSGEDVLMPRWAHNKMPASVKQRYFELIRAGHKGADAARRVGVSTSCGSLWFIDAGSMIITEPCSISPRFLTQDDSSVTSFRPSRSESAYLSSTPGRSDGSRSANA